MDNQDLEHIQQVIGYRFQNWDLLQQAFVRRSYSEENGGENNEVLEMIHDGFVNGGEWGDSYHCKVYRCKKCGYSKKYKSF